MLGKRHHKDPWLVEWLSLAVLFEWINRHTYRVTIHEYSLRFWQGALSKLSVLQDFLSVVKAWPALSGVNTALSSAETLVCVILSIVDG